ncbi:MAG: hypothetical protein JWM13_3104, partial [Arthrobacter sp.]|nr:hypothetical protein [Arthrobacter sp.]
MSVQTVVPAEESRPAAEGEWV